MAETRKPTNKERMQEITAGIERGIKELFESERYMKYLQTMSRFHHYSVNNQVLIHMQMPNATLVASYNKWHTLGRHVKKNEKGLKIIAPKPFKKKIEEMRLDPDTRLPVLDREGKTVMEEKEVEIPKYGPKSVFDVSQTEGRPLPHLAADLHGDVRHYEIFMEALRRSSPVPMGFEKMQGMDGYYSKEQQRVAICEGMSEVQTVCAAIHEITHAKLHNYEKARLEVARGDKTKKPSIPKDKATEEVEAESVSYAVCQYYGIETGENSFGYIASWSSGKELPELRASLETISKTASSLITEIDQHFKAICKERGIDLTAPEQTEEAPPLTAASLAAEIDEFSYDVDPYHYRDSVEDREQEVETLTRDIKIKNVQYLRDFLQSIQDQDGPYVQEAKSLLDKLNTLAPLPDKEAVFLLDNLMYLYIQSCDTGYDYTLYEKQDLREYDGGQLDRPDLSIDEARAEIVALHELTLEHAERVSTAIMDVIDPPPVMPGIEPPQGPPYDVSVYTDRQWEEIKEGWASKVDTSLYSNPAFNAMQMHLIREGLEKGWPVNLYAKPELSWEQMELVGTLMDQGYDVTAVMVGGSPVDFTHSALSLADTKWLLRQMEYDAIPKMLYTPDQWAEIRQGMEGGLDVKQYADPRLPAQDMARLRDALERGLIIQPATEQEATSEGQTEPAQSQASAMLPDAPEQALDEYPMPDQTLTHADLTACGYTDGDMLPLSKDRALELFEQDLTIYTISGTGEASMAFEREDIVDHGGMFAVPDDEWEDSRDFYDAIEDRKNHQEEREKAFLQTSESAYALYRLQGIDEQGDNRLEILNRQQEAGVMGREAYDLIYTAPLPRTYRPEEMLEVLYNQFRHYQPTDYHGPSLSDGDIVALKQPGVVTYHYCDGSGFRELPGFLLLDNPLKNVEMALEDDYGMIDGVINNGPKQPTVAELEAQVKAGEQISLLDLANAVKREQGEKKKSVVERLKQQPPQQDRKKTAPKKSAEREL